MNAPEPKTGFRLVGTRPVRPDGIDKVTFVRVPTLDEVPYPVKMEPNLVVEFYSR